MSKSAENECRIKKLNEQIQNLGFNIMEKDAIISKMAKELMNIKAVSLIEQCLLNMHLISKKIYTFSYNKN